MISGVYDRAELMQRSRCVLLFDLKIGGLGSNFLLTQDRFAALKECNL
eukprot:COSAG01_NODE_3930_length_5525_cov_2.543679_5_plen_48_part_00